MGMFTWKTSDTGRTVVARHLVGDTGKTDDGKRVYGGEVVVILPSGKTARGLYDGYGNVGEHNLFELYNSELNLGDQMYNDIDKHLVWVTPKGYAKEKRYEAWPKAKYCTSQGFMFSGARYT